MTQDRRRCPRKPLKVAVQIKSGEEAPQKGITLNVSPGGLAVVCGPLAPEDLVSVQAGSALMSDALVRFQKPLENGSSLVGLELVSSPSDEGLGPGEAWRLQFPGATNRYAIDYHARLRRLEEYILENLDGRITLEDAAQIAALEKSYFCRYFHRKVGIPFIQWMQRVRLQHCIDLLLEDDCSVTEACFDSGFGDLRHFQRTFRKWTDLSPTDFRGLVVAV
ncbi:MAG TPA: helix-turn-helix domain-containing protein [Acidobacteriota bacterium]|nr:helix-turn-helix domain-containing protein [Acidobacteriota bacterium]